jgi:hypothetical protein
MAATLSSSSHSWSTDGTLAQGSHSGTEEHTCVELAKLSISVGICDSKAPDAGYLALPAESFARLIQQLKQDRPDT